MGGLTTMVVVGVQSAPEICDIEGRYVNPRIPEENMRLIGVGCRACLVVGVDRCVCCYGRQSVKWVTTG